MKGWLSSGTTACRDAVWEGILAPDKRKHLVQIAYRVPQSLRNLSLYDVQPRVRVLDPTLELHSDYEERPLPHVYVSNADSPKVYLCLFDPENNEWSPEDSIAHTTVFWAAEWLYFYEGWLVTKKWRGGGRHRGAPVGAGKPIAEI